MHTPAKADYNTSRTEIPDAAFVTAAWCASSLIVSPRHGAGNNAIGFSQYLNNALTFFFVILGVVGCSNCAIELRSAESSFSVGSKRLCRTLRCNSDCSRVSSTARSITFSSSRTLPGQSTTSTGVAPRSGWRQLNDSYGAPFFVKCFAKRGISSGRSRSGGNSSGKTFRR